MARVKRTAKSGPDGTAPKQQLAARPARKNAPDVGGEGKWDFESASDYSSDSDSSNVIRIPVVDLSTDAETDDADTDSSASADDASEDSSEEEQEISMSSSLDSSAPATRSCASCPSSTTSSSSGHGSVDGCSAESCSLSSEHASATSTATDDGSASVHPSSDVPAPGSWYMTHVRYQPKTKLRFGMRETPRNLRACVRGDKDGNPLDYYVHYELVGRKRTRTEGAYHFHSEHELLERVQGDVYTETQGILQTTRRKFEHDDHSWTMIDGARPDQTPAAPINGVKVPGWKFSVFQETGVFCARNCLRNIGIENEVSGFCSLPAAILTVSQKNKLFHFVKIHHSNIKVLGKYVLSVCGHCVSVHNGKYLDTDPRYPHPKSDLAQLGYTQTHMINSSCYQLVMN